MGLRPERPGAPQGAGSPARRCLATHGRSRQRGGWGLAGQCRLSPEPWWVCGGAWAGRSHHLQGHFRLLGLRGCQSKLAEGEPSIEKESPLNRRKPRCVRPSSWALLRSPAALHPRPAGSSPSLPALHLLHCAPLPTASSLSPSPQPPPTRPLWGPQASPGPGGEQGREPAEGLRRHQRQRRFLHGRPVEAWGAPGRVQRGGLGQGQVCGVPWGFTTLGPTPDLAVTTPHCADRAVTGPGLPPTSYPLPASGQQASTRACSSLPTRPTGTTLTPGWSPYTPPPPLPPPLMAAASPAPCPVPAGGTHPPPPAAPCPSPPPRPASALP